MGYHINFGASAFAVPGVVVDHFIRLANETQLKVLLYLLRHGDAELSVSQTAGFLKLEEELVEEAFQFWSQANVLDTGEISSSQPFTPSLQPPTAPPSATSPVPLTNVQRSSKEVKLDPSEITAMLKNSQELTDLFALSEKIIGRLLNHMEQRSLVWLHSYLNIRSEVIVLLLNYCVSIEKYSISYVEAIAVRWEQEGILTMEQAEEEIQRMTKEHTYIDQLRRMFEMKRNPTKSQMEYITAWQNAGYSIELLQCAYEITIENIEKLNFKYMNTILEDWAAQGAATPEQAKQLRSNASAKTTRSRKKQDAPLTDKEIEEMNAYMSLTKRVKKENDT